MREIGFNSTDKFPKLMICPHCGVSTDSGYYTKQLIPLGGNQGDFWTLAQKCTNCNLLFIAMYHRKDGNNTFLGSFPQYKETELPDDIQNCSPRFCDLYYQAQSCRRSGSLDLAAMGYRSALECLIKDFAINELHENTDTVSKKTLADSIITYLDGEELIASADVVRILGNDYTHFQRKFPEYDIELLEDYLNIFIDQIQIKLKLRHPPVARKQQT